MSTTAAKRCRWLLIPSLLASLQLTSLPLLAQTPAVRFEHLSVDDGLSHSAVTAVVQDRRGFLWLGTRNGLNRYDGYRFRIFQHDREDPTSLSGSYVKALMEDGQGELWIGTPKGLNRFHRAEERFIRYRHDPEDSRSLSHDYVNRLLEDHTGSVWVGTDEGLNRLAPDGTFVRYLHDPADQGSLGDSEVLALAVDREGRLWVGTDGGLDLFDRQSATFRHFRHDPADPGSLGDNSVLAIQEDADGGLWVGTARGLNRFDGAASGGAATGRESATFTRYRHGPVDLTAERIFELSLDREGELWVGAMNAGLIRIPRGAGPPTQYRHDAADPWSLNGDRVSSIFEDESGILWAGTWVGLNKYDRRREQFAIYRREPGREQTLTDSNVSAILEDRSGVLWVGTWDKGLNRVDRERGTVVPYQPDSEDPRSLPDDTVVALCEDRSGTLWVATWSGLARLDGASETQPRRGTNGGFTVYRPDPEDPSSLESDAVNNVYEDRHGRIWVGTTLGLSRFEPASDSFVRYRLGGGLESGVNPILEDYAAALWVGSTSEGLFYLSPAAAAAGSRDLANRRHDPGDDHSLGGNKVNALYEDRSGNLWIGTDGAGLDRLDRLPERPARARFAHYREPDGLASNQVLGILEDDAGHLWLSTSRGLSRLDPRTGTFRNFGVEDGLQSNVFSYFSAFKSPRGEMFFGGTHGFNAFFPEQIRTDPFVPAVVLTDFQLFNETVPPRRVDPESLLEHSVLETSEIRLSHRHDVFSLEFAALHYASPEKNRYAYRLEGFDSDWITTDAGRRLATYTNLDAGTYRFRVRGGGRSGVWNEEEATVRIVVAPPPWKSWWAYGLYTLTVSAAVLGAVRSQQRKHEHERAARQKELDQERTVSRRLREVDKLKNEFLANTSHELRTPLYGITGLVESLIDGVTGELPEATKANLAMVAASGRRLTALVDDILDFSKLTHKSLRLRRRPVDLRPLAEVVLTLQGPLAASKDLELINAVPPDLPAADADEARLEQILHNLVGNAVKFTEEGKVEISAAVEGRRPSEGGQAQLRVAVEDTGIGIPEDKREQIFKAFEQADSRVQRAFGGTGLGLTVTRELVELHGGSIRVESTVGQGTRFSFTLPISTEQAGPAISSERSVSRLLTVETSAAVPLQPGESSGHLPAPADPNPPVARILVVDDEPVNLQVLANQLALESYHVELAASGSEALRLIEKRAFDLVVLDVMMPRMSGYEVCRALRERRSLEDLPVIFLTAKNQVSDLVAGLAAGGSDYLAKPIGKDELLARVRTHLELLSIHRRLAAKNAELARFNYTVAHDLQNPLTTIINFLGLARRDAASGRTERLERDLDRLDAAASKLRRLLDELFELSRVGVQANPPEEVAFGELVDDVLAELAGQVAERGVEVEVAPDLPAVAGDRARLLEAVRHLLANAVKYLGDQPAPRIEVGVRAAATPDAEPPTFYVRDNGMGIDPEYHDKVFGLFERLDPEASEGTGIGLALVKRIVEVHDGKVWVESDGKGRGATFCLTLPGPTSQIH